MSDTSSLEARHLRKAYGSRKVVHDVSVQVRKGEVVGLLGPNGAGKTTSFYMIVGLVRADGGQILIDGQDVTRAPMHKRSRLGLSYLPQEASVFRKLSVADNVRAILELQEDAQGQPLSRSALEAQLEQLTTNRRQAQARLDMAMRVADDARQGIVTQLDAQGRVDLAKQIAGQERRVAGPAAPHHRTVHLLHRPAFDERLHHPADGLLAHAQQRRQLAHADGPNEVGISRGDTDRM